MPAKTDNVNKYAKHLYGRYISGIAADTGADSYLGASASVPYHHDPRVPELSLPIFSSLNSPFLQCLTYISSLSFISLYIIADK